MWKDYYRDNVKILVETIITDIWNFQPKHTHTFWKQPDDIYGWYLTNGKTNNEYYKHVLTKYTGKSSTMNMVKQAKYLTWDTATVN